MLIDDYLRYMWSIFFRDKAEVFDKFKKFKEIVEREIGVKIKILRTDRGGEFCSNEFRKFCEITGIFRYLIVFYFFQ